VWDLAPAYEAVFDADQRRPGRPVDLPAGCVADRARKGTGGPAQEVIAQEVIASLRRGTRTHVDLAAGWGQIPVGRRPEVFAVFARGHATPAKAILSDGRLVVSKRDADWLPDSEGWPGGDGTVPADSAVPVGTAEQIFSRRAVWDRHGPMGVSAVVEDVLVELEAGSTRGIRGGGDPGIAVDVDDSVPAGQPIPVAARLVNAEPDERSQLSVRLRPVEPGPDGRRPWGAPVPMAPGGDRWEVLLPPMPAGTYEIEVTAEQVPRVAPAVMADLLDVVDDEGGGAA